jgi:hypothetical protein
VPGVGPQAGYTQSVRAPDSHPSGRAGDGRDTAQPERPGAYRFPTSRKLLLITIRRGPFVGGYTLGRGAVTKDDMAEAAG